MPRAEDPVDLLLEDMDRRAIRRDLPAANAMVVAAPPHLEILPRAFVKKRRRVEVLDEHTRARPVERLRHPNLSIRLGAIFVATRARSIVAYPFITAARTKARAWEFRSSTSRKAQAAVRD
jgi:hypothetical protein